MSRSRSWCFTHNNPPTDVCCLYEVFSETQCKYCIIGSEISDSKTPHKQGFFVLHNAKTLKALVKSLNAFGIKGLRLEATNGSSFSNVSYCSKDNDFKEFGIRPKGSGSRSDIDAVRESLKNGSNLRSIVTETSSYQAIRIAEKVLTYLEPQRQFKPYVIYIYGPTGVGKSRIAFEILKDPYVCQDTITWWDGYDAHEHVLLDDLRGSFSRYNQMLKLLDRYPYRVAFKGGYRQFLARVIVLTSCKSPSELYSGRTDEQQSQFMRRLDEILFLPKVIQEWPSIHAARLKKEIANSLQSAQLNA